MANRHRSRPRFAPASHAIHHRRRRRPALEALEDRIVLATFMVNSTGDSGSGSGDTGDLRYCINHAANGDTIDFASAQFGGGQHQTITLSDSPLNITKSVNIQGPDADFLTIDANYKSGVMTIAAGTEVSISGLTLTHGKTETGGGIYNNGNLTLTDCTITGDTAKKGGGIYSPLSNGSLHLYGCTISDNTADFGGGITNIDGAFSLSQCTVAYNSVTGAGGGIFNYDGKLSLDGCTVVGNSADVTAGGINNDGASMSLNNTIAAMNSGGDVSGPSSGSANMIGGNPKLGSLELNGGTTPTMAPLSGSPVIGAGDPSLGSGFVAPDGAAVDQRGAPRIEGGKVDIGAVESGPITITVNTPADQSYGPVIDGSSVSLRQAIAFANDDAYSGDTIDFDIPDSSIVQFVTITLSSPLPTITGDLTIDFASNEQQGAGTFHFIYPPVEVSGGNQCQILSVAAGANVLLDTLTLTDGSSSSSGGAILNQGRLTLTGSTSITGSSALSGGGIYNEGTLAISSISISGCSSSDSGGGIFNTGTLNITSATISGCSTQSAGGAIENSGGTVVISSGTVAGNQALLGGAIDQTGVLDSGSVTISSATLSNNMALGDSSHAAIGGALDVHSGTVTLEASTTLSGNVAQGAAGGAGQAGGAAYAGAIAVNHDGSVTITDSTLSGNSAQGGQGGAAQAHGQSAGAGGAADGGAVAVTGGSGSVTVIDSTLSGNTAKGGQGGAGVAATKAGGAGGAGDGGAIAITGAGGSVKITGSTLSDNSAQGGRGGAGHSGAHGSSPAQPSLSHYYSSGAQGGGGGSGGAGGAGGAADGAGIYLAGGALDLTGSTLAGNVAAGGAGATGGNGGAGGAGAQGGTNQANHHGFGNSLLGGNTGAPGGAGGVGGGGGAGGPGGKAAGGGLSILTGSIVGLVNSTIANNQAVGGNSGSGGDGGKGGRGGDGGSGVKYAGIGGAGANGGSGGAVEAVGRASGGGIEDEGGTLTVHDTTIADNQTSSGVVGTPGTGGLFGKGGENGLFEAGGQLISHIGPASSEGYTFTPANPANYVPPDGTTGETGATNTTVVVSGGGLAADSGEIVLTNTLVAANTAGGAGSDVSGSVDTSNSSYNLIGIGGAGGLANGNSGNQVGVADPGIGSLADNGGTTETIALLSTSPAIATGNPALATNLEGKTLTNDQRGNLRFIGDLVDIGAYEYVPQAGSTLVVTTLVDQIMPGSLRLAVDYANAVGGTIEFASGLSGTLTLDGAALPVVTGNVTIEGISQIPISGAGSSRILEVDSGGTLTLTGLTLTRGYSISGGGAILDNGGMLSISSSTISDSRAAGEGAAIENSGGTVAISSSAITEDDSGSGGAIWNENSGSLTLTNSTVSNNHANDTGGALVVDSGTVTLESTTLSNNQAVTGGALVVNSGTVKLEENTILSGNKARGIIGSSAGPAVGGALAINGGSVTITDSNITDNTAQGGDVLGPGGIGGLAAGGGIAVSGGTLDLNGSLVTHNAAQGGNGGNATPSRSGFHVLPPGAGGEAAGGGVYVSGGIVSMTNSIVAYNSASGGPGGVNPYGSPGTAGIAAGGIEHDGGTLYLINSTVAYNQAAQGSGSGTAAVVGGIAAGNGAGDGVNFAAPVVSLANTLVALNTAGGSPSDISGSVGTQALYSENNLIGTGGAGGLANLSNGNLVGVADPGITGLIPGDGPSGLDTIALLGTSPAITAGSVSRAVDRFGNPLATDETGNQRILEGTVDIGAFEAGAQSLVVTTLVDQDALTSNPGFGAGTSLREAINYANELDGAATITFAPGLSGILTVGGNRLPVITGDVGIVGPGAAQLTISGNSASPILAVAAGGTASVRDLTLANGQAGNGNGGAIMNAGSLTLCDSTLVDNQASSGGAIYNDGTASILTVNSSTFDSNSAANGGGCIDNDQGTVTINSSTFDSNDCIAPFGFGSGGAIYNAGTLTVNYSTLGNNDAAYKGAGIYNLANLTVNNSTFVGNQSSFYAGGIWNAGTLLVNSSTFTANRGLGGAINNSGALTISSSTIAGNSGDVDKPNSSNAGGIYSANGTTTLTNTIVAGNADGDITSQYSPIYGDDNVIGILDYFLVYAGGLTNGQDGNQVGTDSNPIDPMVAELGYYGGPTETMPLLAGSPAIGKGTLVSGLTTDQRAVSPSTRPSPTSARFRPSPYLSSTTRPMAPASFCHRASSACGKLSAWPMHWAPPRP